MSTLQRDPIDRVRVLDDDGRLRDGVSEPDIDDETLLNIYRWMRLARHFDERAVSLQRQGRMGTFPPLAGQEAAQVASSAALESEDWVFPTYREHAACHVHGEDLAETLRHSMGDERGERFDDCNVFPISIPIATQIPHAVGMAWAAKRRGERQAFVCHFGDGATSEGDFHEGLNFAGVFDVPVVFFCNNNGWAISVPRERQTASETLAQKADAYGIEGVQVDGMDPIAVYQVTKRAVEKAKADDPAGSRPTLIEAVQYRFGAHTTADDPSVYRDDEELERWRQKDPIPRLETFLRDRGLLDDEAIDAMEAEIHETVATAIEAAESSQRPHAEELFEHVYEEPTEPIERQRAYLRALRERYGDEELLE
ncbi:MAG: pyruvate dehydrogenase (acetyl-transferring) E1 component subunit alpha [Natronomonas sp.]